jgi:hypothetical protein
LLITYLDVALVLLLFWVPPAGVFITLALREIGRLRRERRKDQAEAEAMAAEGFPPPGPPTTDSLSDDGVELEPPDRRRPPQSCS